MPHRHSAAVMRAAVALAAIGPTAAAALSAQERDTVLVAGSHYAAGGLHRSLFGTDWRSLWTTPIRVTKLDLATFAGGLTPTTAGGGFQTLSLRFRGADGYQYGFRSVDKDPSVLPPEFEGTVVQDVVRDQTRAQHPAGPAVAAPLMEAAGILHTDPVLVVLPDDARLGEHRRRFAGAVGFLERRAIVEPGRPGFAGALAIEDTDELLPRLLAGPADRVDAHAFLRARLFDVFIGDWDRHRGQWSWARFTDASPSVWTPLPEDRDMAFVRFDGLLLSLARVYAPQFVKFGPRIPDPPGLMWNGRDLDRMILGQLEWPSWDSVARDLQGRLSDPVIARAVDAMPEEYRRLNGETLAGALRGRRDGLPEAARRFYLALAREAEVHATRADEVVSLDRHSDGATEVTVSAGGQPWFRRRYRRDETKELRLFLYGGADRVTVRGGAGMLVRVVGTGQSTVVDSSSGGRVRLYARGSDRADGPGRVAVDGRPFPASADLLMDSAPAPRDWGSRWRALAWGGYGPDAGLFLGSGFTHTGFGFRSFPYSSEWRVRAGWAFGAVTGRVEVNGIVRREASNTRWLLDARASGIDVLRFHGFGNESPDTAATDYYRVKLNQITFEPAVALALGARTDLVTGPFFRYSAADEQPGRILEDLQPYGTGRFGRVGWRAELRVDTRDANLGASRGLRLDLGAAVMPELWSVRQTYGEVTGLLTVFRTARGLPFQPTLALRAGGKAVIGPDTIPFQDAAYIGDPGTVRLGQRNRFAGTSAAWGSAELRLRVGRHRVVLPGEWGVHGLADAGRVFVSGETSERWHSAFGGGVWMAWLKRSNVVSASVASSREAPAALYFGAGFAF